MGGIMAAILASLHTDTDTADELFGTPQESPRADRLIAATIRWAKRIMEKIECTLAPIDSTASETFVGFQN